MNTIYFVAGLHGDEQIPVKVLSRQNTPFLLGNPKAYNKNVRFLETDLNKSFGTIGNSLEENRAREILRTLTEIHPAFIIDFHTTSAITDPFAIIVDQKLIPQAKTLNLKHIVYMKHNIKSGHSLIDHYPGVSVEAGIHKQSQTYTNVEQIIASAYQGKQHQATIYEVYDIITEPGEYHNFKMHADGFIPVLAGERSYDFYGLKSRILEV